MPGKERCLGACQATVYVLALLTRLLGDYAGMTALVVLGVLGLTALFLAGLLTYLYRWRVRKRLFPQLPRLWKGDRSRFFISTALFAVSLLTFMVVSLAAGPSLPDPPQKLAAKRHQGPSFDGSPPPLLPSPTPAQTTHTEPDTNRLDSQAAMPAPATGDQLEPKAQPQQLAVSSPKVQQQPAAQTPAPSVPPVQQTPSPQTGHETPAAQSSQSAATQPKVETPPAEPTPGKPLTAPSPAVQPQAQTTPTPGQPQTKKKDVSPKTEATGNSPVEPTAKSPVAKVPAKTQGAKKTRAQTPAKTKPPGKTYSVCVASFKDRESAQRQVERLANKGLKGRIVKAKLKGKGVWHRVCLGEFPSTRQAAAKAKAWRNNDLVKTPFVVRLR